MDGVPHNTYCSFVCDQVSRCNKEPVRTYKVPPRPDIWRRGWACQSLGSTPNRRRTDRGVPLREAQASKNPRGEKRHPPGSKTGERPVSLQTPALPIASKIRAVQRGRVPPQLQPARNVQRAGHHLSPQKKKKHAYLSPTCGRSRRRHCLSLTRVDQPLICRAEQL
ncbi:hypothetical protein NDU88_001950 [Pleurodeles waltl]|uniref:Uncharacterized protein n=1 Tax=Pleurodeles waltl TaxID=8319 RepID=A0AAV7TJD6_PLEWA|nr:hypothetical protein NDU88_001950 [Pleurodeles waltl]